MKKEPVSEPFDDTAKAFYQSWFSDCGISSTREYQIYARARSIDLVVPCTDEQVAQLKNTGFSHFRALNALELKGPGDRLDLRGYNHIMMRAWGLGATDRRPKARGPVPERGKARAPVLSDAMPTHRTVTIICVSRPDRLLNKLALELNIQSTPITGIYLSPGVLNVWIIVPSELPFEEKYYPFLPLARGRRLEEFIETCWNEERNDYLSMALDVGVRSDPAVWIRVMEKMTMHNTSGDHILPILDKALRLFPDLSTKSQVIREILDAGEQKVRQEVQQRTLIGQMMHKFGTLSPEIESRVRTTGDVQTLDRWLEAVLDAATLDEFKQVMTETAAHRDQSPSDAGV